MIKVITINTIGQGLTQITAEIQNVVQACGIQSGLCSLMIRHTSASLLIQENADPSAQRDLENWMNRMVSENDSLYTHTSEGADDMPAHIKSMLTQTTLSVPFDHQQLLLGTWQGIFLWEHRHRPYRREVVIHLGAD